MNLRRNRRISHSASLFFLSILCAVFFIASSPSWGRDDFREESGESKNEAHPGGSEDASGNPSRERRYSLLLDELSRSLVDGGENILLVEYGGMLGGHRDHGADELTVENDYFWAGATAMKFLDPRFLYARILLLMKEGRVNRAWHTAMFTCHAWWYLQAEEDLAAYSRYLVGPMNELRRIALGLAPTVGEGLDRNALEMWEEAIAVFDGILEEYPSLAHANAGKASALAGSSSGDDEAVRAASEHFRLARRADPFWSPAYADVDDSGMARVLIEGRIVPDLVAIRNWSDPSQVEYATLYRFAGNCRFIGAEEYSIYALMMALELISLRKDGDPRYAMWEIADSLRAMGRLPAAETFLAAHKAAFALE